MKRKLLGELILPCFWLFFFIVFTNKKETTQLKIQDNTELKRKDILSSWANNFNEYKIRIVKNI